MVCPALHTNVVDSIGAISRMMNLFPKKCAKADGITDVFVIWSKDWLLVPYDHTGLVAIGNFGMPGDSGSCLLDENRRMVAVLAGILIDSGRQTITIVKNNMTIFADIEAEVEGNIRLPRSSDLGPIDQLTNLVRGIVPACCWGLSN